VLSRALSKVRKYLHTRPEVIAGIGGKTGKKADCTFMLPKYGSYNVTLFHFPGMKFIALG
jgi:hypothetical protein